MLDSLRSLHHEDTDIESPMDINELAPPPPNPYLPVRDIAEASLEAQESYKYLLAKSYFDTREYDRCAAVFLPPTTPPVPLSVTSPNSKSRQPRASNKGKDKRHRHSKARSLKRIRIRIPNSAKSHYFSPCMPNI